MEKIYPNNQFSSLNEKKEGFVKGNNQNKDMKCAQRIQR